MPKSSRQKKWIQVLATATAVVTFASMGNVAYADPSDDAAVDRARANERAAERAVSDIQTQLAQVSIKADEQIRTAQIASQDYLKAQDALDAATEKANKLKEEADKAKSLVHEARMQMSHITSTVYRQGASPVSSLEPYLSADGLQDLYIRQIAVEIFGAKAEAKLQTVSALEEVASVIDKRSQKALNEKKKATQTLKDRAAQAKQASDNALAAVKKSEEERDRLLQELAEKRGVTLQAERQRQEKIDAERRERENAEQRRRVEEQLARQQAQQAAQQQNNTAQPSRPSPQPYQPPVVNPPAVNSSVAETAIAYARSRIGIPYVWGGTSDAGYDCSGLMLRAFQYAGVSLPRVAQAQYYATKRVPLNQIQPGDMLFWGTPNNIYHVAIYVGNGRMIEAPMPGMNVHETNVYYANIMPYAGRV